MLLRDLVGRLEQSLPALRADRERDAFANDVFEAADDLLHLGQALLAGDTRMHYPARVGQERELWSRLQPLLRQQPDDEVRRYEPLFELAEQLLSIAAAVQPSRDGHLGFLRIARERFAFLENEYGFAVAGEEPARIRFAADGVWIELAAAKNVSSSCAFGGGANPDRFFWIDDLLYLRRDPRHRSLPEELRLDGPHAIDEWLAFLAGVFREHGQDVLSARPGIFEELAAAQDARDREHAEELKQRHREN